MNLAILTWLTTYALVVLCELGDKTQVAVLLFTCNNPRKRWLIWGASALALTCCVLIEVTVGVTLARYIGPALINRITGFVFLGLGTITLARHFRLLSRFRQKKELPGKMEQTPD